MGPRWASQGRLQPEGTTLASLLKSPNHFTEGPPSEGLPLLAPIDPQCEVWAAGVTYMRSRVEREAESTVADVYSRVYEADRPELFFKSTGRRAVGPMSQIRIRNDSVWNVPEPELALVINSRGEIVGYTAGNDVSSRSIEGENPLYLPQAKVYDGSCALGHAIYQATVEEMSHLEIRMEVRRGQHEVFSGETTIAQMKRSLTDLVEYLFRETSFPDGVVLMTGTGIVPTPDFTLQSGDEVSVTVGQALLVNRVA